MRGSAGKIGVLVLATCWPAAVAHAQITYDPSSAAGKQYEIPLEVVRAQGGGGAAGGGGVSPGRGSSQAASPPTDAAGSQALFGAGIAPPKRSGSTATSHRRQHGRGGAGAAPASSTPVDLSSRGVREAATRAAATARTPANTTSPLGVLLVVGAGIGGLAVAGFRRRRIQPNPTA